MAWTQVCCQYDGSYAGFLTCVFENYVNQEEPVEFRTPDDPCCSLYPLRTVVSDQERAGRVYRSLGPRLGAVSVGIYLAVGLVGIPVFAAGGGPAYLIRPTFGFLLGFLFAAWLAGKISRMGRRTSLARNICAAVVGMGAYYLSGILYFYFISNYVISMPVTWALVLVNCFILTASGDLVLSILAAMLAVRLRAAVDFM